MDLPNVLLALARDQNLIAWRSSGTVLRLTPAMMIMKIFIHRPYKWAPGFADLIATDWTYGTADQLRMLIQQSGGAEKTE